MKIRPMPLVPTDLPAAPRLHLTLQRDPARRGWQADLQADGVLPQHFDSLAALIAWLTRLDTSPVVRGIR